MSSSFANFHLPQKTVTTEKLHKTLPYLRAAYKMLMKLTLGINFTNPFCAH